jgi:hypothetical protein
VRLVIHDPIQPPALDAPTVHDARQLAERVHDIIAGTVEESENGNLRI